MQIVCLTMHVTFQMSLEGEQETVTLGTKKENPYT